MKKIISSVLIALTLLGMCVSASATNISDTEYKANSLKADCEFISDATLTKNIEGEVTEFTLTDTTQTASNAKTGVTSYTVQSMKIVAFAKEEAEKIEESLGNIQRGGSSFDHDWFLGDSLYIYGNINFSTKNIYGLTYYKMDNASIKISVNSGTAVDSTSIKFSSFGVSEYGGSFNKSQLKVFENDYATAPSWDYVGGGAKLVGANFYVKAYRPSGNLQTFDLPVNVAGAP